MREPKVGPSLGLRLATARVNLQLVKLEQHVARPWSADAERIARIDGAVLDAWSRRETSAYLTDTAEHVVEALDPMVRQTHADILTLVDRIDTVVTTAREGTDRLARWTKVLTIVGTGLLLLSGFQIWLVWLAAMHR